MRPLLTVRFRKLCKIKMFCCYLLLNEGRTNVGNDGHSGRSNIIYNYLKGKETHSKSEKNLQKKE